MCLRKRGGKDVEKREAHYAWVGWSEEMLI
jgi:hypothetical protein